MKKVCKVCSMLMVALMVGLALAGCGGSSAPASSAPASVAPAQQNDAPPQIAQEEELYSLNFNLTNYTNAALTEIRVSISTDTHFGENLLPAGYVLPDGNNVDITFDSMAPAGTTFDMYTMDSDGDSYEYTGIPLTKITELVLYVEFYQDGSYNNFFEYA